MIALIWAQDEAGGIGLAAGLPWPRLQEDMDHFRKLTKGRSVIMGRKTFETLGSKPLPTRMNIVVSSRYGEEAEEPRCISMTSITSVALVNDLDKAVGIAKKYSPYPIYVIGGSQVYQHCFPLADVLHITKVAGVYPADTYWNPDLFGWEMIEQQVVMREGQLICTFEKYTRIASHE